MSWVASLASGLGTTEAALKLILGQGLGYPLMLLYRRGVATQPTYIQHLYFFLTGLFAAQWVIGADVAHSLYAILGTYLIVLCAGGTLLSVILSFAFNFLYLLVGYIYTESDGYDICWTMPHCVLCLRLIGLTFDCYDGERCNRLGEAVLSKDQKKSFLTEQPSLLEMLSHSFFIGGYFVGPQFPMKKYRELVRPDYISSLPGSPVPYAFKRLGLGVCYMLFHVIGSGYLPSDWPSTLDFSETSFILRLFLLPIWVKVILAKYIFAWLVAEGVCVLSGLSFVEQKEDGFIDWKGCANVKVGRLETAVCFGNVIEAFNINTNHWVAVYVYKRLKFMGNQMLSQVVTLFFLAVWHGFHSGYYITFVNEFMTIKIEREFLAIWGRSEKVQQWRQNPAFIKVANVMGWVAVVGFLPHNFLPFSLLLWTPTYYALSHTYFIMYIIYIAWWLGLKGVVKDALCGPRKEKVEDPPAKDVPEVMEEKVENDTHGKVESDTKEEVESDTKEEVESDTKEEVESDITVKKAINEELAMEEIEEIEVKTRETVSGEGETVGSKLDN